MTDITPDIIPGVSLDTSEPSEVTPDASLDILGTENMPESVDTSIMGKIKSVLRWLYDTIFNYDTLIIVMIIVTIILIIYIYNIYKNKIISIELKEKLKRIEDKIKNIFNPIYNFIVNVYSKIKSLILTFFSYENKEKKELEDIKETIKKEVFNIDNNIFKYKEAEQVCKSLNSEVASKEQVEKAHEEGANWCNYGWSKDGLALYPIQKEYYEKLKSSDSSKKNQCGYPGVNGGKLNPNLKLGVNCYGIKPLDKIVKSKKCSSQLSKEKNIDTSKLFLNQFNCTDDSKFN